MKTRQAKRVESALLNGHLKSMSEIRAAALQLGVPLEFKKRGGGFALLFHPIELGDHQFYKIWEGGIVPEFQLTGSEDRRASLGSPFWYFLTYPIDTTPGEILFDIYCGGTIGFAAKKICRVCFCSQNMFGPAI